MDADTYTPPDAPTNEELAAALANVASHAEDAGDEYAEEPPVLTDVVSQSELAEHFEHVKRRYENGGCGYEEYAQAKAACGA